MTKTRTSRLISMFLCVCMAVLCIQGLSFRAAADAETYTVTISANGNSKTIENVTLPRTFKCDYNRENGELDLIIRELYEVAEGFATSNSAPSSDNPSVTAGLDGQNQYFTITSEFAGSATISGQYANYATSNYFDYSLSVSLGIPEAHTHNYAFSANGDTITVNCDKAGCTEPPYTASITLIPPTLTTEGGEGSPEATILCTGIDEDFLARWHYNSMEELIAEVQGAIEYYNGEEELDEAPTEAGDYTAELSVDDGEYTAVISYTIAEATPEPDPDPAPSAPIVISGTAKAASGGAPGLVSGTSGSIEMLTWNAQLDGSTLTWEAKDGADGFVISIRAKGAKAFKRFDRVTEKSADLSKLKPGTYTIYVRYEKDGKLAKCRQSARTTITIK
ncbi:MAG: hypothetical protein IKP75_04360 [Oscillospiraceae bacterium]|nr:hypothetical protein [Oscillospiraceae bacterium]